METVYGKDGTDLASEAKQDTANTSLSSLDGKLPTAAAPADGAANAENATSIRARIIAFNGATWDRIRAGVTALGTSVVGWINTIPGLRFNATPTTRTEGQFGPTQGSAYGGVNVSIEHPIEGENAILHKLENLEAGSSTPITTNTTTTIKTGAGALVGVLVGLAGTTSQVVIYDNTAGSGTVLATLATTTVGFYRIPAKFATGCTLVTTGGAAATIYPIHM